MRDRTARWAIASAIVIGLVAIHPHVASAWTLAFEVPGQPALARACVDAARFRRLTEGQRAAPGDAVDAAVGLRAWSADARWHVELQFFVGRTAPARRELAAATCDEALAAAALIVALALDTAPPMFTLLRDPAMTPPPAAIAPPRVPPPPPAAPRPTHRGGALAVGAAADASKLADARGR